MFRSLMFKSNPLTQQFQRYRRKISQTLQVKPFSIRKNHRSKQKSYLQKNLNSAQIRKLNPKSTRYDQTKNSINLTSGIQQSKLFLIDDKKEKCKFIIHNKGTIKNDNYLQKDEKNISFQSNNNQLQSQIKNKIENPQINQNENKNKFNDLSIYNATHHWQKLNKQRKNHNKIKDLSQQINQELKIKQKPLNEQIQNQLKSTLYQSIDLGNLFQKIYSNIDQSQTLNSPNIYNKKRMISAHESNQQSMTTKKSKLKQFEHLNQQLSGNQTQKNNEIINKFNLKSLIEKNTALKGSTNQTALLSKQFIQSLTSRDSHHDKTKQKQISMSKFNESQMHKSWMPNTRKRSSVIVMDENGIIREDNSGDLKKEESSLRMSMKLSNLRQMMKGDQLD